MVFPYCLLFLLVGVFSLQSKFSKDIILLTKPLNCETLSYWLVLSHYLVKTATNSHFLIN